MNGKDSVDTCVAFSMTSEQLSWSNWGCILRSIQYYRYDDQAR